MEFKKVNDPMNEELFLNCVRDSEIVNENNWTNKDIMRAFNLFKTVWWIEVCI